MARITNQAQQFANIAIIGDRLVPTSYGDGFDAGDVLTYDVASRNGRYGTDPHFALVVARKGNEITLLALNTVSRAEDLDERIGTRATAKMAVVLPEERRHVVPIGEVGRWPVQFGTYMTADLSDGRPRILGCDLVPWDGQAIPYRHVAG